MVSHVMQHNLFHVIRATSLLQVYYLSYSVCAAFTCSNVNFWKTPSTLQGAGPAVNPAEAYNATQIFALILTTSTSNSTSLRRWQRQTWLSTFSKASTNTYSFRHRYLVTQNEFKHIREIGSEHEDDFIVVDAPDGYWRLTRKVIAGMQYAVHHYQFRFLLKTDDDSYIHVPVFDNLLKCAEQQHPQGHLYAGRQFINKPTRSKRWRDHSGLTHFIPFMAGAGYIISSTLVQSIVHTHSTVGLFFSQLEDVAVGVWLHGLPATRVDFSNHTLISIPVTKPLNLTNNNVCPVLNTTALVHKVPHDQMGHLHALTLNLCSLGGTCC